MLKRCMNFSSIQRNLLTNVFCVAVCTVQETFTYPYASLHTHTHTHTHYISQYTSQEEDNFPRQNGCPFLFFPAIMLHCFASHTVQSLTVSPLDPLTCLS